MQGIDRDINPTFKNRVGQDNNIRLEDPGECLDRDRETASSATWMVWI